MCRPGDTKFVRQVAQKGVDAVKRKEAKEE